MDDEPVAAALDTLWTLRQEQIRLTQAQQQALRQLLTQAQRRSWDKLQVEYAAAQGTLTIRIEDVERAIRTAVLTQGRNIQGQHLDAIYTPGEPSVRIQAGEATDTPGRE